MKTILLICLLISLGLQVTVTDADKCSTCTELKSQKDCEGSGLGCEWKNSACSTATTTPTVYKEYCSTIADPATKCAKTFGCAYIDSKCTHFTGCTAYVKTTLSDCQAISYQCITNGTTCDDVKLCKDYTKDECEVNPSPFSPFKCKWDNDNTICRDYKCSEADTSLAKNADCDAWLDGCITTGYGCTDTLQNCNQYTGTATSCDSIVGKDGKCTLDSTSTASPQACKLRICSEAKLTAWSDDTCGGYQSGCKSTGFSCVDTLQKCSTYSASTNSCLTYVGSDGKCAADTTNTANCKVRACEDKQSGVLSECQDYGSCVTNGAVCVATLGKCNTYKGTITTCAKIVGSDGNCKGTSATDSTVSCALKDCATDAGQAKTDTECKKVQSFCVGTGLGCVQTRASCTTYTDDGNCQNYIGQEGKCKTGAGGATPKCAARACADNTTATKNEDCQNYLTGCVTNGAGCVQEATCTDTVSKLTCTGTTNNYSCAWSESCVAKDCTAFSSNQSLCSNTSTSDTQPCIWKTNACYNAVCGDFTETEDGKCAGHMSGCVTNGTKCANPANCGEFSGNMTTCRGFTKAKCTNTDDSVPAATACVPRTCTDVSITATQDSDCDAYLTGCLLSGDTTRKCIGNDQDCSQYYGGSTDDCSKFTGYKSATEREACWWTGGTKCVVKTCDLATGKTGNTDCSGFLPECVYDGDGGCVDQSSPCTSFKFKSGASQCSTLFGKNGADKCFDGSGSNCKKRTCADAPKTTDYNTDPKCDGFLGGCLTIGAGCIDPTLACSNYSGTSALCATFKGNSIQCQRTLACTNPSPPASCTGKIDATSNAQCVAYKSNCALTFGTKNCQDQAATCAGYTLSGTVVADKVTYCNSVLTTAPSNCAYDPATTGTCVARTCALWSSSLGVACTSYAGPSSCSFANGVCYTPTTCESHVIPGTITVAGDKVTHCNKFQNSSNRKCTFDASVSATTCKTMNKCEEALSPTTVDDCYDQTGQSNCVLINSKCVTIKTACTGYDISGIGGANEATDKTALCKTFKSQNLTVFILCKYDAAQATGTCVNATCEDISSPTKQADCSIVSSTTCHYFSSKCYTIKDCAQQVIPGTFSADDDKLQFCQNMYNTGGTEFCSFDKAVSATNCGAPKLCTEYVVASLSGANNASLVACNKKRDKTGFVCTYTDSTTLCADPASDADKCTLISTGTTNEICDTHTTPLLCKTSGSACVASVACGSVSKTVLADCQAVRDPNGYYCTFVTGAACSDGKSACTDWTGAAAVGDCTGKKDKHGNTCEWVTGNTTCTIITANCKDAVSPTSQADCDLISAGCIFYNASCIKNSAACTDYTLPGSASDNPKKLAYCNGRVTTGGSLCTFTDASTTCVAVAACSTYTAGGADNTAKLTFCQTILSTDNYGCTFLTGGTKCLEVADLCTSYTVASGADCTSLKDNLGRSCIAGASTTCAYAACGTIVSPGKQDDCDAKVPGCLYYSSKCITPGTCASYATGSTNAIAYCGGLKDTNGVQCTAGADNEANCKDKLSCSDDATKYFTTHKECSDYLPTCKSTGMGCVPITDDCSNNNGDSTQCAYYLDATGLGNCTGAALATDTKTCDSITCDLNVTATSQQDCDNYIVGGNCRWINPGCVEKSIPCSQYRGTQTDCQKYVGNGINCYSDSTTVRGACRDRTCADKTGATSDDDCKTVLPSCLYNGKGGCIDKTSDCTLFSGTSTTCMNMKGLSGAQACWSGSTTVAACKVRTCIQLSGTSDGDCEAFMPSTHCITDGSKCVVGPKTCNQFTGNDDTCGKLTASDGPCKASSQSVSAVSCTPKVCYEAPNTYTTDAQCKLYHSSCKTNGRGCQSSVLCSDFQNKTACGANSSCLWATSCRIKYTACSSLTSQTLCVNNPGTKCAWFTGNGVSANAVCRDYQCADYDATLTTHDACQKASTNKCTTTGAGCVKYSTCSTYTTASMCAAAQTTETQKKCTWENAVCRPQQCKDLKGATNDICDGLLSGCKSNGTSCIGPNYSCSDFNGSQDFCLIDSTGQPCYYNGGTCYSYDNCTDVASPTQTYCQTFSTNCVVGQTTCIALNQCSKYDKQVSCLIGVSKTTCGWTPDQKCAEFKQCGDAAGTTWEACRAWNTSCVSDGSTCVPIGDCGSYLKQTSCENNVDATGNACFWSGTACRLKQCTDVTATTDADCQANVVKEGVCTTDGTKCVVRAACTAYGAEAACTIGADGSPCIFAFPLGTTTGTKTCRAKDCTDNTGTTNEACGYLTSTKQCVSNGKTCLAKSTCASQKNKVSCSAGGTDSTFCVFTAAATTADPLAGNCVAFTSCGSANGDKVTCLKNASCKYTDSSNTCSTTDCATFNTGACKPFPSFDGKSFTICTPSASGCTAGDPTTSLPQGDCFSTVSKYAYTWNASTSKCQSCKGSSSTGNNSSGGNTTTNDTTTDSGYVLGASVVLALLGFMA